jgi:hypothetical protein
MLILFLHFSDGFCFREGLSRLLSVLIYCHCDSEILTQPSELPSITDFIPLDAQIVLHGQQVLLQACPCVPWNCPTICEQFLTWRHNKKFQTSCFVLSQSAIFPRSGGLF